MMDAFIQPHALQEVVSPPRRFVAGASPQGIVQRHKDVLQSRRACAGD